jgi:CheY-like chemotaxis protein
VSKQVLIVDDEPDIRLVTRLELSDWGLSVEEARSGEEALEYLRHEEPDAVLLDLRMPGVGGWAVLEQLAADGRLDETPVVLFSAHLDESVWRRASALGCKGYVPKPYRSTELREALSFLLSENGAASRTATGP